MATDLMSRAVGRVRRDLKKLVRMRKGRKQGIVYRRPNYIFLENFEPGDVLIDIGCSYEADLSQFMIDRFGVSAFGVDPTRKHAPFLRKLEQANPGSFTYLQLAISGHNGTVTFHESAENESGSLLDEHTNVRQDTITSYDVESLTLTCLLERIGVPKAKYLKLDIEGAEYALLSEVTRGDLRHFEQVFIEFHHHATNFSADDTRRLVRRIDDFGFTHFTLDDHNYLFIRQ